MTTTAPPNTRPRLLWPTLAALPALVLLLALGTWQVQRLAWKNDLITTLERRLTTPAAPLGAESLESLTPATDEFRRVVLEGRFPPGPEALVYATGTTAPGRAREPGWLVFAPFDSADGRRLLVLRGFVPEALADPARRSPLADTPVRFETVLRFAEAPGSFTPAPDLARRRFYAREAAVMAPLLGLPASPFYFAATTPTGPAAPVPQPPVVDLRNNHFGYALTWYGLAGTLVGVYGVFAWRRFRAAAAPAGDSAKRSP
jgi:surfeit locus 1 family protein